MSSACMVTHATVAAVYPQLYSNCSSRSSTASYKTYVASQEDLWCVVKVCALAQNYQHF